MLSRPLDMTISETQAQLEAIQHNLDVLVREIQQVEQPLAAALPGPALIPKDERNEDN